MVAADGEPIHAGKDEFAKALKLIAEGKPIRYEGVIGPVSFDEFGDITGPFRLWRIQNGEVTTVGEMSADEVDAIKARPATSRQPTAGRARRRPAGGRRTEASA